MCVCLCVSNACVSEGRGHRGNGNTGCVLGLRTTPAFRKAGTSRGLHACDTDTHTAADATAHRGPRCIPAPYTSIPHPHPHHPPRPPPHTPHTLNAPGPRPPPHSLPHRPAADGNADAGPAEARWRRRSPQVPHQLLGAARGLAQLRVRRRQRQRRRQGRRRGWVAGSCGGAAFGHWWRVGRGQDMSRRAHYVGPWVAG